MERTGDGHHVVIDGRRWRATDPSIPERFAAELRSALMAARRAVKDAKRTGDDAALRAARRRVNDAKVALGERGAPWWEPVTAAEFGERAEAATRALLDHRGPDRSICPSDIARTIGGEGWRSKMDEVRAVITDLAQADQIRVTQKGTRVEPPYKGPIRITGV